MTMPFVLHLACNDHRNGLCQGYFDAAHLSLPDEEGIEFDGPRVRMRESEDGKRLVVGKVSMFPSASKEWYGNWCWNAYWINSEESRSVVNYLKLRGWAPTCAPDEWFTLWPKSGEIRPEEWRAMFP